MSRVRRGVKQNRELMRQLRTEMTNAETRLWAKIRAKQIQSLRFRRQHGIGPYIVDFYCSERSLVIEVDGDIHADQNQIVRDRQREVYLTMLGLEVIRYCNDDILNNLEGVLEDLSKRLLRNYLPSPLLTKEGNRGASR